MPKKSFLKNSCIATAALGFVVSAMPAHAGFQWVTPPSDLAPANTSAPTVSSAPIARAANAPEVVSPVVITGDSAPAYQAAPSASTYASPQTYAPAAPAYQQVSPQTYAPATTTYAPAPAAATEQLRPTSLATATIAMPPSGSGDVVQGFGAQIPLALALRQILPVGYSFTIDPSVSMDTLVSYQGGKSWHETLKDMLRPMGLAPHEQGTTVTVDRNLADSSATTITTTALVPSIGSGMDTLSLSGPAHAAPLAMSHVMADVPSMNVGSPDGWTAERGETLRKVLTDWCRRSGVELQWIAEYDYPMEASAHFSGGFEDAVRSLLAGFENAHPQPVAELHTNPGAGQMLLVIQARGNSGLN